MHSCEPLPAAPSQGPTLLQQLGRLIIRARSTSPAARPSRDPRDRLLQAKLRAANPSTSAQVTQPKPEREPHPGVQAQLESHVQALWTDQVPLCIEVLLAPDCAECYSALSRTDEGYDKPQTNTRQGLLLERWTMRARVGKSHEKPAFITSQWLLNAVRSQLHFSQLSAWLARLTTRPKFNHDKCNYKKLESNCDETDPANEDRQLNIVYCVKIPGEHPLTEFTKPPTDHSFPITDIGNNIYLNVNLESLPRIDGIPNVKCTCQKRRASKEIPVSIHEELVGKLNDLTITQKYDKNAINSINSLGHSSRRLSIVSNTDYVLKEDEKVNKDKILDDRMHTNCSENGKHKCSCDEESDRASNNNFNNNNEPKKLDERRLKEIAKYKRRLRKESKLKKLCDSTSSEGDGLKKEPHTSIPILQASRFDRFRAIGCYRNQTYLTLPASRIECKSPFIDSVSIPPTEFKKTVSISTQTDDILCQCGVKINLKCESCRMVRSNATYDLTSLNQENVGRRKREEENSSSKKLKCDNLSSNMQCDSGTSIVDDSFSNSLIKRPKLRRFFPIVDRIEKVLTDRCNRETERDRDMEELNLKTDDSVFVVPKPEAKRQKTFSISEDYVTLEKCDYGTFDRCDMDSPQELTEFKYSDLKTDVNDLIETPKRYYDSNGHSSSLYQDLQNFNQATSNLNQISPEFHQSFHEWNQFNTNLNYNASNLDHNASNSNNNAVNSHHNSTNLNNNCPNLNNNAANLDHNASNFNHNAENSNYNSTNLNNNCPNLNNNAANLIHNSTNLNNNCPNLKNNAANLSQNSTNLNNNCPSLNNNASNLSYNATNLNNNAPNLNHNCSNLSDNVANSNHTAANLNNVPNLNQTGQQQNQDPEKMDHKNVDHQVPSPSEMDRFRWRFDSAASMVFHTKTGLPLTSSPAPLRRGNNCFDFDDSINGISGIKSALFHPISPSPPPVPSPPAPRASPPSPAPRARSAHRLNVGPSTGLLGSFEESALKGRLEPVATVAGFTAELGASGAFCPPHRRLPVTVFFYAPGGTNAPYMGHINLGPNGYRVARSGTIQVSLFNPHGTLVKMFVVLYDLTCMPPMARTFLRQRTLYMPAGADAPRPHELHKWLRYLIHLRFMTSKSGKLYLHTDIRILVSRKADLDTATAHSALFRPIPTNHSAPPTKTTNQNEDKISTNGEMKNLTNSSAGSSKTLTNSSAAISGLANNRPNRVFGGCGEFEDKKMREIGYENQNGVSYELRSFTYAPENPRYSPR